MSRLLTLSETPALFEPVPASAEPAGNVTLGLKGYFAQVAQVTAVTAMVVLIFTGVKVVTTYVFKIQDEHVAERQADRDDRRLDREAAAKESAAVRDVLGRLAVTLDRIDRNQTDQARVLERIERRLPPESDRDDQTFEIDVDADVQRPTPAIKFPTVTDPPRPLPTGDEPFPLSPYRLFVIESNVPLLVFPTAVAIVDVTKLDGPQSVFGKFADEPAGKNRLRPFDAKYLYVVEPLTAGDVELLLVPKGAEAESEAKRIRLRVGLPRPPPDPPKPPPVPPSPATPRKLATVVIEETADTTAKRSAFFGSAELTARFKAKGHEPPTVADQNVRDGVTNQTPAALKAYVERAKGKALPQLYLVDAATRDVVYEGPVPDTVADFLKLLDRVGG